MKDAVKRADPAAHSNTRFSRGITESLSLCDYILGRLTNALGTGEDTKQKRTRDA